MKDRPMDLFSALLPIAVLIALLGASVVLFDDMLAGPGQFALLLAAAVAMVVALLKGHSLNNLMEGALGSIGTALNAIMILFMIGALAGTWMISGVVPAMIYYGLELLNPTIFLFAACLVCSIVSLATGSSWATIATVGIALMGIGGALGIGEGLVAGAVISGAYFGDKMSPLSDTTNLAPAVAGAELFEHIRYMMWTTIPSIVIALLLYLAIGFFSENNVNVGGAEAIQAAMDANFNISPWLFLVPISVIVMIMKKMPALPALFIASLLGAVFAIIFQPDVVRIVGGSDGSYLVSAFKATVSSMTMETAVVDSGHEFYGLMKAKGMAGMLNTNWLVISAMFFGGVMEVSGALGVISKALLRMANSTGSLVGTTAFTCIFFNVTAADQYMAIVVPGKMVAKSYEDQGLDPKVLSRTLEDAGTVTSVLVPWNTCGATQASVLGVATVAFIPFCFFNLISPVMTVLHAYIGFRIARIKK